MTVLVQRAYSLAPAVTLILLAGALPRLATASCGDYVILTGVSAQRLAAVMDHGLHPPALLPASSSVPTAPCRGPHCSGRQNIPSAPPPPVRVSWSSELPGMLTTDAEDAVPGRCSWNLVEILLPPQESLGDIFHPPRQAS